MSKIKHHLPNLDALVPFEAAARLSSFALAADELNVTPSAVSQQIKSLEQLLDTKLFVRGHRSVHLTDHGKEFHNSVAVALMHLSNAASDMTSRQKKQHLTIAGDTSIITYWLMPRFPDLVSSFPDVNFRIHATDVKSDLINTEFDLAILHGSGQWTGFESRLLFSEDVFPVCAPHYLQSLFAEQNIDALDHALLLDLEYESWDWMNWTIWLTEMGLASTHANRTLTSNSYPVVIDAARAGLGVALAWRHFHDDDLASGTLIAPLAHHVSTQNGYYLVWPYKSSANRQIDLICDWLQAK